MLLFWKHAFTSYWESKLIAKLHFLPPPSHSTLHHSLPRSPLSCHSPKNDQLWNSWDKFVFFFATNLAVYANQVTSKNPERARNHNFNYCPYSSLRTNTYVLTNNSDIIRTPSDTRQGKLSCRRNDHEKFLNVTSLNHRSPLPLRHFSLTVWRTFWTILRNNKNESSDRTQ